MLFHDYNYKKDMIQCKCKMYYIPSTSTWLLGREPIAGNCYTPVKKSYCKQRPLPTPTAAISSRHIVRFQYGQSSCDFMSHNFCNKVYINCIMNLTGNFAESQSCRIMEYRKRKKHGNKRHILNCYLLECQQIISSSFC